MNTLDTSQRLWVEFKETTVSIHDGKRGAEFAVERDLKGQIASRAALAESFRSFIGTDGLRGGAECVCALPARGVSLRTVELPAAPRDKLIGLLTMQLEAQLPVSPTELAWGFLPAGELAGGGMQQYVVAALKKEFLEDYQNFLRDIGLNATFTVAALNRKPLTGNTPEHFSVIDLRHEKSELVSFHGSIPQALRILPWGANSVPTQETLTSLQKEKLYVTGGNPAQLAALVSAEVLALPTSPGVTAAIANLQRGSNTDTLFLSVAEVAVQAPPRWKYSWAVAACLLGALALLSLRYAEPVFKTRSVKNKIATLTQSRSALPKIEHELTLLTFIKTNQPPYLDTVAVIADCAPPGTKIDSLAVLRRGEVTLRGSVNDPQAPARFRSKLVDSGFFSKVTVEEQTPLPNGQQVNFRLSAQLKPEGARKNLLPEPPMPAGKAATNNVRPTRPMPMMGGFQ